MMNIIEKESPVPAYLQLKNIMLDKITKGEWQHSNRLPSENQLCRNYNISRITAREAIKSLANEGVIYTVHGKGTFINTHVVSQDIEKVTGFFSQAENEGFKADIQVVKQSVIKADENLASKLKISPGKQVIMIKRIKSADDEPLSIEMRYLPSDLCADLLEDNRAEMSLTKLLKDHYHLVIKEREMSITPYLLDKQSAELLKCKKDAPAVLLTEVLYLDNKRVIKWEEVIHKKGIHLKTKINM